VRLGWSSIRAAGFSLQPGYYYILKPDLTPLDYYLWGHMKTLVYETKVESRAALRDRIFAAAEHIHNHPDNIASATQSLLMRAENCIATRGGHFEQLL
jgi:hypothetical protein